MILRLKSNDWAKLLSQDESGMGYQIVRAEIESRLIDAFVFNAELLMDARELVRFNAGRHEHFLKTYAQKDIESFELRAVLKVADFGADARGVASLDPLRRSNAGALAPSPILRAKTTGDEGFIRFTPYDNDRRVGTNGDIARGTYATTVADARFAVSGLAVAGRYALPNPAPAVYARTIVPPRGILFTAGTVRPAYDQSGGGVEVLFDEGCPPGSASGAYKIPDR